MEACTEWKEFWIISGINSSRVNYNSIDISSDGSCQYWPLSHTRNINQIVANSQNNS